MAKDYWERYQEACGEAGTIFLQRNLVYRNAFRETGVLGAVVECTGCSAKLKELVIRDDNSGAGQKDRVRDALIDLHNFAIIALMMLEEDNWKGESW